MDFGLFITITWLAIVDAINVCAFAVLTMVLMTILIQNPEKKKQVLLAGFAFSFAVFAMYFIYGAIIYTFFRGVAGGIRGASPMIYNFFIVMLMIVGALNIKDYFIYKPGSFATEMPIFMRPKVRRMINRITSPKGAFVVGIFVTLFLLPCTMLPFFAAINKLTIFGYTFVQSIPWLLYYNVVFVSPMMIITLLIYFGFSRIENVSGWRERNIKLLHLIAGILLFVVGVALLVGWI